MPPVPTAMELYLIDLSRILQIGEEIETLDTDIQLMETLLSLDPEGENALMIRTQIDMLQMSKRRLEEERQQLRNGMIIP